ncbi:two-component system regulatory protein YycI [Oceanobacillus polygoni]|uniref:Regulatory protein YycI of two-component signal transduction system YycFG n=1 Tax=Oceanobacillus polygoni TaxID=1235259 RepID=A0A9X1CD39_9BACI|nr:two-component system regulatory protein YycI [Oceanobacillus polygoni]MBP2078641.1 regulatory protein YycI of two-component signal transduction system YycFG [Oceanobacillus polygoni]
MQWGHIKTLFILSFLILNIYLLIQFVDRQQDSEDRDVLDNKESSLEEQLESENITLPAMEYDVTESNYISVSQKTFTTEEQSMLNSMDNLTAAVIDNEFIIAQLREPIPIPVNTTPSRIADLLAPYVAYSEEYEFWDWNEEYRVLIFSQLKEGRPVYLNGSAIILAYLNRNNEITHYTQMMLGESSKQGTTQTVNPPIQAIATLFYRNNLVQDDEVTEEPSLGYLSRIVSEEGSHVFAPTWKVTVNGSRNYFVNAIEGLVYAGTDAKFLEETIKDNIKRIEGLPEESEIKEAALRSLERRLEIGNRSEIE